MIREVNFMDLSYQRVFIRARGFPINSDEEISMAGKETVIGKYIDEVEEEPFVKLYLDYSHDPLHPKGGHITQLREALCLGLTLDHYGIPYEEIPKREVIARNLFDTVSNLRRVAEEVNPKNGPLGTPLHSNPKKYVVHDSPVKVILDYTETSEEPLRELEIALKRRRVYDSQERVYGESPSREVVSGSLLLKAKELERLIFEVDCTFRSERN